MDKIAAFLVEKETITGKEFMDIFRAVKGLPAEEATAHSENLAVLQDKESFSQPGL